MTETRLRTHTHLAGYGLATLALTLLAGQNLIYGFYELFFVAASLVLLMMGGAVYTLIMRRKQLTAPGHKVVIGALNLIILVTVFSYRGTDISFWLLPVLLLNLLILPLRWGIGLSLLTLALLAVQQLLTLPANVALSRSAGALGLFVIAALYIWHYDHMAQSAEDLAITDPDTGAHNARFLDETLQKEISRSRVTSHPLAVVALQLDYLQETQRLIGDEGMATLNKDLTGLLFSAIRAGDTLYSTSQGSYFLILPFTPEEGLRVIAERIRRTIAEQTWPQAGRVTVSVGCTIRQADDTRASQLKERALAALTQAQKLGTDRICYLAELQPRA
ncbi:MAG: GGDEF domain-containing protein [Marinobacter sp.]|nr:GGDEF domain-containing protein [Marinobacter sp.]